MDPVFESIKKEALRQRHGLELIASENYASDAVLEAQGSILTNKYAEGYPGKRYYGGCTYVDEIEELACARLRELFGVEDANVQPHSGSQANMAVFFSYLRPGDTIMGMDLAAGGHLTHGSPVNFSGRLYNVHTYGVNEEGYLDYEAISKRVQEVRPRILIAGASSYPRVIDFKRFGEIAKEVDAKLLVDMAHIAGLVATGLHPTPIGHAEWVTSTTHKTLRGPRGGIILGGKAALKPVHSQIFPGIQGGPLMHVIAAKAVAFGEALKPGFKVYQGRIVKNARALAECLMKEGMSVVSGGTDNHLVLVDLRTSKGCEQVTGKQAQEWLDACGMTCNKNAVPGELRKPQETSGIRLGTAALSTRGMSESDMAFIAASIVEVLRSKGDAVVTAHIQKKVEELASGFPIFKEDT